MREPSVAIALLQLFSRDEALVGDILEEYETRRSRPRLWRQVAVAVVFNLAYGIRRRERQTAKLPMPIGGISFVVFVALITVVAPGAWWLVAMGAVGGVLLAVILVAMARRRPLSARNVLLDR